MRVGPSTFPGSALLVTAAGLLGFAATWGAPTGRTGAPPLGPVRGELTCAIHACHEGNSLDQGGTLEILGIPEVYAPGVTYPLTIRLASTETESFPERRWGFEITAARLSDGEGTGSFSAPGLRILVGSDARTYVTHDPSAMETGQGSPVTWSLGWTAPPMSEGAIGFYAAGAAADGNGLESGDFIYTAADTSLAVPLPVRRVTWGALKSGRLFASPS